MSRDQNLSLVHGNAVDNDIDINLVDVIRNIWRQRGLVVAFIIIFSLLGLIFHVAKATFSTPHRIDYPVSLTFLNSKSEYPNGAPFGLRDIISPTVVQDVIEQMGLSISVDKVIRALHVRSSNSLLDITEANLTGIISNQKTAADIRASAEASLKAMREQTASSVTISLDLEQIGLTQREGEAILRNIMDSWARVSIEKGLADADISRPTLPFVVNERLTLIDLFDNAAGYYASLNSAAVALSTLPGSSSLVVQGFTLDDVRRELKMLNESEISPLREFAYSKSAELAAEDSAIQVRLFSRQRLLNLEHQRLTKLIESYDSVLSLLNQTSVKDSTNVNSSRQNGVGAQMDQSFLDSMLDLGSKLGSVEIRQHLFESRTKATEQLLDLEKEIAILTTTGDVRQKINAKEILSASIKDIEKGLNSVRDQLDRLIITYRSQTLQSNGRLYVADAAPVVRGGYVLNSKIILHVFLAMILGGMIGVIVALARSAMLNNRVKQR